MQTVLLGNKCLLIIVCFSDQLIQEGYQDTSISITRISDFLANLLKKDDYSISLNPKCVDPMLSWHKPTDNNAGDNVVVFNGVTQENSFSSF